MVLGPGHHVRRDRVDNGACHGGCGQHRADRYPDPRFITGHDVTFADELPGGGVEDEFLSQPVDRLGSPYANTVPTVQRDGFAGHANPRNCTKHPEQNPTQVCGHEPGSKHVGGENDDYEYDFPAIETGESRAQPGRGIRETYLSFGLSNTDGQEFQLDNIEVEETTSTTRRV